jgi:membrane fusion protein (multidrug efflux system)
MPAKPQRNCTALAIALLMLGHARGADDLPERSPGERLDFEPSLQLTDIEPEPAGAASSAPPIDLARAKATLDNARRKQQRWQQLARRGVLSKAEVESSELQVARAAAKYEAARVRQQQEELEALRKRAAAGEVAVEAVQSAEAALQTATAHAAEAAASLRRTELMLAETNAQRQRQLHAAGIGSRNQLRRAEELLQKLRAAAAP